MKGLRESLGVAIKLAALARRPQHVPARLRNKVGSWFGSGSAAPRQLIGTAALDLGGAIEELLGCGVWVTTPGMLEVEEHLRRATVDGGRLGLPFSRVHDGTETLGRICYSVCRFLRPNVVVETGVARGVTSAYILQALVENGCGELHSVDLPPLGGVEDCVGCLVPIEHRQRWRLHVGSARRVLPRILGHMPALDVFVHDSLHTYSHMRWELRSALSALRPGGVVVADDIEGNSAFEEVVRGCEVESWFAVRQAGKSALCGAFRTKVSP